MSILQNPAISPCFLPTPRPLCVESGAQRNQEIPPLAGVERAVVASPIAVAEGESSTPVAL